MLWDEKHYDTFDTQEFTHHPVCIIHIGNMPHKSWFLCLLRLGMLYFRHYGHIEATERT